MKNTGQILKDKRESLNLTISEVALSTKINPKILTAMEAGASDKLPSQTFLKGFVKSYALFLKLDQDQLLKTFIEEMNPGATETTTSQRVEPTVQSRREVSTESNSLVKTIAVGAILVLIGLIFGVRELITKYQKETVVEEVAQINVTPLEKPTLEPLPNVKADEYTVVPEESTPVSANEASKQEVVVESKAAPSDSPAEVEAQAEPVIAIDKSTSPPTEDVNPLASYVAKFPLENKTVESTALAKRENAATEKPKVIEAKIEPIKPETTQPEPTKSEATKEVVSEAKAEAKTEVKSEVKALIKNEIILEALDKVEIKMDIKGTSKKLSLGPTEVHTIHASGPVKFDFSDGGAVNIILNGRERGVPGDLGKPKQVNIP